MNETQELFEKRKQDHLRIAMDPRTQAPGLAGFDRIGLIPEALPDLNFSEVSLQTKILNQNCSSPFFISSMTAGHERGELINSRLARLSHERNILMGVGSQRRQLDDDSAAAEWTKIRKLSPQAKLIGNLGIAQIIQTSTDQVRRLVDSLHAVGLFIHLNSLQECLQMEGTPDFRGGLAAIEKLVQVLPVPVIVKEVGCGFSVSTLQRLSDVGVTVVDISGVGGTHWGRIEGLRADEASLHFKAALTFKDWGISTIDSLVAGTEQIPDLQYWASGGVRTGLDGAKLLAIGAKAIGVAQPFLQAAMESDQNLDQTLTQLEYELKVALFCTGLKDLQGFRQKKVWTWK